MGIRSRADRLRHHLRRPLAKVPYLWDAGMMLRPSKRITLARPDTAIVIDGFLRSGNTFSVAAFQVANGPTVKIGRHLHGAAHILRAVRLGLPTVVLVREPRDAVASYLVRRPTLTPDDALREYLDFYRTAWRARGGFVIGLFDEVVADFGAVVRDVNARFGTAFVPYSATPENEAKAFTLVEEMNRLECRGQVVETHVGRPSTEREQHKRAIGALLDRPRTRRLLSEAQALHQRYVAQARRDRETVAAGPRGCRVLLVGKGAPDRGGIPSFLEQLRDGELGRRHRITFLNLAHDKTRQGGRATIANLRRTVVDAVAVWRVAHGHDVVHLNSALAPSVTVLRAGLLALAGRTCGCRVLVHAHGGDIDTWLGSRRHRLVMRVAMWPADLVAACWSVGEEALAGVLGADRVRLVDNGVDVERFAPAPGSRAAATPRLLYVGLLTPRKGVLELIEASRALNAEGVDHELLLLGGTPDEGPAAAEPVVAAAAGLAKLLGTRQPEEMPAVYRDADVFCLPSWWEAMPLSVLEAMASGLPVVATDVGDVPRAVADGDTGLLVPVRAPADLTTALRKLLVDPTLRQRLGTAGRRRVERLFSASGTAEAVDALYAELRTAPR
jgi:glycosyltransferase involved in cell wall biosynthesis